MNCEQLEAIVLDIEREYGLDSDEKAAALAHLSKCPHCTALQESWHAAKEELRALGEETVEASAPARVEMRLRQEFRTRHRTLVARHRAVVAAWALAAAAVLIGIVSWWDWQQSRRPDVASRQVTIPAAPMASNPAPGQNQEMDPLSPGMVSADELSDFTPLPGAMPDDSEQSEILRVRMQRASLGALGLPVNEQSAADWIQVDLLVGSDGLPQAVRLAQEED